MKEVTPRDKAKELFTMFRTMVIDHPDEGLNDEIARVCVLIHLREQEKELEYYSGTTITELRPDNISGREFFKIVAEEVKTLDSKTVNE